MVGWDLPCLTSLQLQNSPCVDDAGVAALAGLTALRRYPGRGTFAANQSGARQACTTLCLSAPAVLPLAAHAPLLNRRQLSSLPCSLNLKQCKRVGDAGLAAMAPKLQGLTALCLQVRVAALRTTLCMPALALPAAAPAALAACLTRLCRPACVPRLQGMSDVTDAGVAQLAQLRGLEDLELQARGAGRAGPAACGSPQPACCLAPAAAPRRPARADPPPPLPPLCPPPLLSLPGSLAMPASWRLRPACPPCPA